MKEQKYDYLKDIEVDIYALEIAWQSHTSNVIIYGELWSEAIAERENKEDFLLRLKDELAEEKARLSNKIRKDWKAHDFTKAPTDKAVESWVILQESYKDKLKEVYKERALFVDLKEKENKLKIVYYDFCQNQKSKLENLVKLHLNDYYSEPQARGQDEKEVVKRDDNEQVDKINSTMTKRNIIKN